MPEEIRSIVEPFGIGLSVWFLTWGLNRVYLTVKALLS